MYILVAALIFVLIAFLIGKMFSTGRLEWCHLGIIAVFAFGHYLLAIIFRPMSNLASASDADISVALGIHGAFLAAVVAGVVASRRVLPGTRPVRLIYLDSLVMKHHRVTFFVALILYLVYFATAEQTSYSANDFTAFFMDRGPLVAALGAVSGILLAALSLCLAIEIRKGRGRVIAMMALAMSAVVALQLTTAQRLAAITPLATLLGAFFLTGQKKAAIHMTGVIVTVLAIISPFMVYLREARVNVRGRDRILTESSGFTFGDNPLTTSIGSIVQRADLLGNTIQLKEYIDEAGYVGWKYYYSVLVNPIPRAIYGEDKPYLLSTDGTIWGEISVVSWALNFRGIGSLTAFGGITAYREGGWGALLADGFAAGVLFAFLARWLGRGGAVANIIYIALLPNISVKRAPPSLLEAIAELSPLLVSLLVLAVFSYLALRVSTGNSPQERVCRQSSRNSAAVRGRPDFRPALVPQLPTELMKRTNESTPYNSLC